MTYDRRQSARQRGYTGAWEKARAAYLRAHPLCKMHADVGEVVAANVVDHVKPHRGDMELFWDSNNWQPLCKRCHDSLKKLVEAGKRLPGCGIDGVPVDPSHHWRRAEG